MEISEIKGRLALKEVLEHYGLKPDKYNRLHCPFHADKTPSLQIYYKTQSCYCFSTNCPTHGRSLDVIDFVMHKENCSKHEAIKKCESLIGGNSHPAREITRTAVLTKMFTYFKNAVHNSKPAQAYIAGRSLDFARLEIGYNSGQFHHGTRKDDYLIESCLKVGLLIDKGGRSRTGEKAYIPFGKGGIVFPLRNRQGQIVSLYFRSITGGKEGRHFYLTGRQGLYPRYPDPATRRLILTESIIDAATLLQDEALARDYTILALYGTNGLTEEHKVAISELKALEEVIFLLNGDAPGRKAVEKHSQAVGELQPGATISNIALPENEDVNSLLQGHSAEILHHFISRREPLSFSAETPSAEKKKESVGGAVPPDPKVTQELNTDNLHNIGYRGSVANYYIKGGLRGALDSLKVSLQIVSRETPYDYRAKADLYEYRQTEAIGKAAAEQLGIAQEELKKDLAALTHLLEAYREETLKQQTGRKGRPAVKIPEATMNQCLELLRSPEAMKRIGELIGKAGVTGEETSRLFLLVIAASYKMPDTLHALIQGSSGSGKTRLLKTICELMPPEDVIKFTRVTDSSLYNYPEDYLTGKLLGFEDLDGLKEDALYAVRELISNEILVSSTTTKTENGQLMAVEKIVRGPIASISCTTKGALYEDNMSRVFLIAVDESAEQTRRIIRYQQQKAAGMIEAQKEEQAKQLLQHCIRLLKPYRVINPFAQQIQLPEQAHKIRRLNDLYLSFVRQLTLLHQYRRRRDEEGRLITAKEDLQTAVEIMFESIVLKVDELDGSLRSFYERLKQYIRDKARKEGKPPGDTEFIQRELRHGLRISKTRLHRYLSELSALEYIQQSGGHANRGYRYRITYWDDIRALRERIRKHLQDQIDKLPGEEEPAFQAGGTPEGTRNSLPVTE